MISLLLASPLYAFQGTTPEAALEEIATATQPEVIVRHLPEPVEKRIESLPRAKKQEVLNKLLEMKSSQLSAATIRPAQDGDGWEAIDDKGVVKAHIFLENAFISGVDAMLPLRIENDGESESFIVTMHLESHEWRIDSFGSWEKSDLGITQLLHEPTEMENNETAAIGTLQAISQALRRYAGSHPEVGFPSDLKLLTAGPKNVDPAVWRYLGILDESFAADPLVKGGYRFRYLLTSSGDGTDQNPGSFELTAVPLEFGETGAKSFFMDITGNIHMTTENRLATDDDPAADASGNPIRTVIFE